jgi:hypothetical protein
MLLTTNHLHPSLIFSGMAGAYPNGAFTGTNVLADSTAVIVMTIKKF